MTLRKRFEWKLKERTLQLGDRTLLMGILNVTPDSFSDGGRYSEPDRAYARALQLEEEGADIIDIGAESTKPGSPRISEEEEVRRLIPVLKRLQGKLTIPISVDTYKAAIAQRVVDLGVAIINDPSGLTFEPDLAKVVLNADAGLVLNHMRGTPDTWAKLPTQPDVAGATFKDLEATVSRAIRAGIDKHRIVIDPGLGFGKRKEQNFALIARLGQFARLELPLLIGPSRKQFLARDNEQDTAYANAAAVAAVILNGAYIVRVHEVREMAIAAQIADAVLANAPATEPEAERPARGDRRTGGPAPRSDRPIRQEEARPGNRPLRPPQFRPPVEPAAPPAAEQRAQPEAMPPAQADDNKQPEQQLTAAAAAPQPPTERSRNQPLRRPEGGRPPERKTTDRPKRSYAPPDQRSDRPRKPYAGGQQSDRPRRPRTDDQQTDQRPRRPRFADQQGASGDRPPRRPRPGGGGGDERRGRPPYQSDRGGQQGGGGDRPYRPARGTQQGSGGGDRPFRPGRGKPAQQGGGSGGDRPFRPGRTGSQQGGNRPPRGDDRPSSFRPPRDRGGDRPNKPRSPRPPRKP